MPHPRFQGEEISQRGVFLYLSLNSDPYALVELGAQDVRARRNIPNRVHGYDPAIGERFGLVYMGCVLSGRFAGEGTRRTAKFQGRRHHTAVSRSR